MPASTGLVLCFQYLKGTASVCVFHWQMELLVYWLLLVGVVNVNFLGTEQLSWSLHDENMRREVITIIPIVMHLCPVDCSCWFRSKL